MHKKGASCPPLKHNDGGIPSRRRMGSSVGAGLGAAGVIGTAIA